MPFDFQLIHSFVESDVVDEGHLYISRRLLTEERKEGTRDFVTSLGDRVDSSVGNLVDVLLDSAPSDVMEKHSPGTGDHAETHRLRGECE